MKRFPRHSRRVRFRPDVRARQTKFPDWWTKAKISARVREQIRSQYTITRDGYVRFYKGRTVFVCGKNTPPAEIEARWAAKRRVVDREVIVAVDPHRRTYRQLISEFFGVMEARVNAPKKPISERTFFNYKVELNAFGKFMFDGRTIADTPIREITPSHFTAYAATFKKWKASGFDSVVTRVGAVFHWAVETEYLDRYRPGPEFQRPSKRELRSQRMEKDLAFTPAEIAKAYVAANRTLKCWIALGTCAGFVNADVSNMPRSVLRNGVIDYRRRKTGKIRRVIPLPPDVVELLDSYNRPTPADPKYADHFFLSENGVPYTKNDNREGHPTNTLSVMVGRLLTDAGVKAVADGRNFKSFRTSFFNLSPRGGWELERQIIMGRAQGTVDLDNYLEDVGMERLRHVVDHVWDKVKVEISKLRRDEDAPASASTASSVAV